jgi:class 3 adenylate cyclase
MQRCGVRSVWDADIVARTQVVTILFCDLVSSTERRARLGDDVYDDFNAGLFVVLRSAIHAHGGREVSTAGDGMMVVFTESAADAILCAIEMHREAAALDVEEPPLLRVGISCGEVAQDGDNYSGMPIVEAARLQSAATPGQTLANAVIRTLVGNRRAIRFRDAGSLPLKGIPAPLATVEVVDQDVAELDIRPIPAAVTKEPAPRRRWIVAVAIAGTGLIAVLLIVAITRSPHHATAGATPPGQGVPAPIGYTPTFEKTTCPTDIRNDTPEATCGYLVVPQDRSQPNGPKVRILVSEAPPRTPVATGTPPTIDVCGCNNLSTSVARDHATLIKIGGRGFSNSQPLLTCPEMVAATRPALTRPSDDPVAARNEAHALAHCYARLNRNGVDLSQYNVVTGAQDELDLMTALHIAKADFTGSGATSGFIWGVVRRAPGAVRSLTLDNPQTPGTTDLSDPIASLSGAFDRYVAQCRADAQCARSYPYLAGAYRRLYDKFAAHPVLVSAPDPDDNSAPPVPVLLDGPRVAQALNSALGNPSSYGLIPAAITEAAAAPLIASQVLENDYYTWHADAPWGALASFYCAYDVHTFNANAIALSARTSPQFDTGIDDHWSAWCRAWPVPDVSNEASADVASPIPALLFRGDLSPEGSAAWISEVQSRLSNSQSAVFPTLGDGLVAQGPPCLSVMRRTFLADPTADLHTAACASRSPKITFQAPSS